MKTYKNTRQVFDVKFGPFSHKLNVVCIEQIVYGSITISDINAFKDHFFLCGLERHIETFHSNYEEKWRERISLSEAFGDVEFFSWDAFNQN